MPDETTRWRCARCGNLTRFDVVRSSRVREFWHLDLSGRPVVEETETVSEVVESVACRWCGDGSVVELVPRPDEGLDDAPSTPDA
jgi:ribosomal protein S27AE